MTGPGLHAERTVLGWERTALALLANGGLLLVRGTGTAAPGAVAVLAVVLAVLVAGFGAVRARGLRRGPVPPARRGVPAVGGAVALLGIAVAVVLALPG